MHSTQRVRLVRAVRTISAFALLGAAPDARAACTGPGAAVSYATGTSPRMVIRADFNADGADDLACANGSGAALSVLLGVRVNGAPNGTFAAPVPYSGGTAGLGLAPADLDGDGDTDLAVAVSTGVMLWRNDGAGRFGGGTLVAAGSNVRGVIAGDFDRDGDDDLALASSSTNAVLVLRNDGTGAFTTAATLAAGAAPTRLVCADFDDDGALDLACTNNSGASVCVYRGDGRGGFAAAITVAAPGSPWGLAVVDANADGRPDLLVSNGAGSALTLLRGTGTGTFTNAASIATPLSPRDLAVADFDGDGTPDVAAACAGTNQLALLRGTAGSFASWLVLAAGNGAAGVAVGDFNRDGAADPVCVNTSANSVTRWLGSCVNAAAAAPRLLAPNGGEAWWPGTAQTVRWSAAPGTAAVDVELSRDGGATWTALVRGATGDHARVLASGAASERMRLRVRDAAIGWRQDASDTTFALCGLLRAPLASAAGCAANHLAVADLDGDGRLDALAAGGGAACVLRGAGEGRFTALAPFTLDATVRVRLADVDGDGLPDLLALGATGLDWRAGDGAGGFGPAHAVPLAHGVDVTCADFDADGHADAAVLTDDGTSRALVVRSAVGSAPLAAEWRVALDASPRTLAHADFDGDGITDLAVSGSSALEIWRGGGAAGRGDARFALASTRALPGGAGDLALGDFDLDGRLDVVACALATGDLFTVGTESATPAAPTLGVPVTSPAGAAAASPVVTDFDGDGRADVALVDAAAGDVRVLAGVAGGFGAPQVFAGGGGELASGDFDGDGVTDLLVARPDQSAVACLAGMCPPLASANVALRARHDGERFVTGFARRMAWSRESGIALARVELSRDGGVHWVTLAEASADTALAWIVTGPATAHARLRVSDAANPSRADVSGEFAIVAPYGAPRSDAWPAPGTGAGALALGTSQVAAVAGGRVLVAPLGGGAWTDAGEADARSVVFADCDGDGREDLVTRLVNFVSVRRALEAGGFGEARMLGTAGANAALVAADFDLDGRADLAVACGTPPAQRVMTFRATAAADDDRAAFAAPGAVALPAAATALVATDVNADGITDLLAGGNGVLATLLGNGTAGRGDGSFRLAATRAFGNGALAALLATDLDRDGATDVAGVDATGAVLGAAGNGAGGFGTPVAFATAAAARALAWGDFDRDGAPDLAVGADGGVTLLRGTARITPSAFAAAGSPLARACALAACDPDADGVADLLTLDDAAGTLRVLPGNLAREREPALTPPAVGAPALGASLTLHWSALDAADLDLSYDDGAHWIALARGVTGGTWRWNVTGVPTGLARLRVRDAFAPVRGDTTAAFAIAPAALGVETGPAPALALAAPWPNPARGAVTLAFALPHAGGATLEICDVGGRRVRTLHAGTLAAGRHAFAWDGRDDAGGAAPAGVYFAALRTAGARTTREFVLAR